MSTRRTHALCPPLFPSKNARLSLLVFLALLCPPAPALAADSELASPEVQAAEQDSANGRFAGGEREARRGPRLAFLPASGPRRGGHGARAHRMAHRRAPRRGARAARAADPGRREEDPAAPPPVPHRAEPPPLRSRRRSRAAGRLRRGDEGRTAGGRDLARPRAHRGVRPPRAGRESGGVRRRFEKAPRRGARSRRADRARRAGRFWPPPRSSSRPRFSSTTARTPWRPGSRTSRPPGPRTRLFSRDRARSSATSCPAGRARPRRARTARRS